MNLDNGNITDSATVSNQEHEYKPPRNVQNTFLFRESNRLQTYTTWPKEHVVKSTDLAAAGLFYSGYADKVTCPWCRSSLTNWQIGDFPWVEHQ